MEEHRLYQIAMRRGQAKLVARELGQRSGGVIPRSWTRPAAAEDNLSTGQFSPLKRGRDELLAQDRVNPETADILLFSLYADVAKQRAELHPDDKNKIVIALSHSYRQAITALVSEKSPDEKEAELYKAGGAIVRAILFVSADPDASLPLRMVDERPNLFVLIWRRLRSGMPWRCAFGWHTWDAAPVMRRCDRCGKKQAGMPRR